MIISVNQGQSQGYRTDLSDAPDDEAQASFTASEPDEKVVGVSKFALLHFRGEYVR